MRNEGEGAGNVAIQQGVTLLGSSPRESTSVSFSLKMMLSVTGFALLLEDMLGGWVLRVHRSQVPCIIICLYEQR